MQVSSGGIGFSTAPGSRGPNYVGVQFDGSEFVNKATDYPLLDAINRDAESGSWGTSAYGWAIRGLQTSVDLAQVLIQRGMTTLQSVYIDNSNNIGTVTIAGKDIGGNWRVSCPGGKQGVFPVFFGNPISRAVFDVVCTDSWLNLPPYYSPNFTLGGTVATANTVAITVPPVLSLLFADVAMPFGVWDTRNDMLATWMDHSNNIAAGGVFETISAGEYLTFGFRKGLFIQNPPTATEPLYLDFSDSLTAGQHPPIIATSIVLAPGAIYDEKFPYCSQNRARVMAATTGHGYIAKVLA